MCLEDDLEEDDDTDYEDELDEEDDWEETMNELFGDREDGTWPSEWYEEDD
jgi:hypothetical protein